MRSCYQSEWRLFRDDLTIRVPGRYYFCEPGTPFFPTATALGSREWHDKNWECVQTVGEDLAAKHAWDNGDLPAIVPGNSVVGATNCLLAGELAGEGIDAAMLEDGFVPQCFGVPPVVSLPWEVGSAYSSCAIQFAAATIIEWLYAANVVAITDFLTSFLGPGWTINYHPRRMPLPAVVTATAIDGQLVWIEGTDSFQQFALQAAYSLQLPTNMGGMSTSPFWYDTASYVIALMEGDGLVAGRPVYVAGHSYGAVTGLLVQARLILADPDRELRFLTFGCPKVGDIRAAALIAECTGVSLQNDGDIITAIPPGYAILWPVYVTLAVVSLLVWPAWEAAPRRSLMHVDGSLEPNADPLLDYATLLAFAQAVLAALPFPNVEAHRISTYRSRILARCNSAEWPVDAGDYNKLKATGFILMEGSGDVLLENGDPILLEGNGP